MPRTESTIAELGSRLQADVLALNGRLPIPPRRFEPQLLIPVGIVLGAALLLGLSPRLRRSVLWQAALLGAAHAGNIRPAPKT